MVTTAIIFDHKAKEDARDERAIEIRITIDRRSYYINTGARVRRSEWKCGQVVDRSDCAELNELIRLVSARAQRAINECLADGRALDVAEIRRAVWRDVGIGRGRSGGVRRWMEAQLPTLGLRVGTENQYRALFRRLEAYGMLERWRDFTMAQIYDFDVWLHGQRVPGDANRRISDACVWNYHKRLKAMLRRAVLMGVLDENPYDKMRGAFRRGCDTPPRFLTEEEMAAIEGLEIQENTEMARARDVFVYMMYTGMAYGDAMAHALADFQEVDGRLVLFRGRRKTGVEYIVQLLPKARAVLDRYGGRLPKISNQRLNDMLKNIALAAGVRKRLTSHVARHTFATWMLRHGASIQNVSKMLGHCSVLQTQRYGKVLAESVLADFDKVV